MARYKTIVYDYGNYTPDELSKTGIYTITSKVNGKIYVGSASRTKESGKHHTGFIGRWGNHMYTLTHNKHYNKHLQNHVNKYGIEDLQFEILEECEPRFISSSERYWINMLDSVNTGFNLVYSTAVTSGKNSPSYIHVDEVGILKDYSTTSLTTKDICYKYNMSTSILNRVLKSNSTKPRLTKLVDRPNIDFMSIYIEYVCTDIRTQDLVNKYKIGQASLYRWMKANEMPSKYKQSKYQKVNDDIRLIYSRYLNGESIKDVLAKDYSVDSTIIWDKFRELGFKTFNYNHEEKRKTKLCFGC